MLRVVDTTRGDQGLRFAETGRTGDNVRNNDQIIARNTANGSGKRGDLPAERTWGFFMLNGEFNSGISTLSFQFDPIYSNYVFPIGHYGNPPIRFTPTMDSLWRAEP